MKKKNKLQYIFLFKMQMDIHFLIILNFIDHAILFEFQFYE
jgi:hypothetical protein